MCSFHRHVVSHTNAAFIDSMLDAPSKNRKREPSLPSPLTEIFMHVISPRSSLPGLTPASPRPPSLLCWLTRIYVLHHTFLSSLPPSLFPSLRACLPSSRLFTCFSPLVPRFPAYLPTSYLAVSLPTYLPFLPSSPRTWMQIKFTFVPFFLTFFHSVHCYYLPFYLPT